MFSISEYNNNLSNISTGGGKGTRNTALKLTTYMLLLTTVIFEIIEPLTTGDAYDKLKANGAIMALFVTFSCLVPLFIFYVIWSFDGISKKKAKYMGPLVISIIAQLLQLAFTLAALIIGNAYSEEDSAERRAKKRGFLYTKVILLFGGMIFNVALSIIGDAK